MMDNLTVIAVVLTLIAAMGSSLNLLVICLIATNRKMWNKQILLVLHLASADFFMSTFGIILPLVSAIYREWIFGQITCEIYAFIMGLVGIATVWTLSLLALDRSFLVRQSVWSHRMPPASVTITFIWVYSFLLTSPPLFGWGQYVVESPGISCSVDWDSASWNSVSYIIFLFSMGFFLPLLILLCSYGGILLAVYQNKRNRRVLSKQKDRAESQRNSRIFSMITVMAVCFLTSWLPYASLAIIKVGTALWYPSQDDKTNSFAYSWSFTAALLSKSSLTYNPIIYVVFNTQFHTVWRNWLRRLRPNQVGNSSPSTGKTTTAGARTTGLLHPSSRSMAAGSSTYSISTGDMQHSHTLRPSACEEFQSVVVHANCDDEPTGELEGIRKEGKE